ncbi:MAG TPA: nicotinate-nucleotide--dimethylbenzimidazole phosphoribosyltransferase [Nitrospina sp.]|jgi:nicotinate-nucleotide--dimethylbenzimidazole phosphoribosyltransferase|nr:nicotinate-nucleotide--dimethylbenzimidazole phosphoribosyltransferase [Nitrospina sp.]
MQETISQTLEKIQPVSSNLLDKAQAHLDSLTKPPSSLGKLEELAKRYVAIQNNESPTLKKISTVVFAADHGVTAEGISAYPSEVTAQMVINFLNKGAAVNVLANHINAEVTIVDIGVNFQFESHPNLLDRKIALGTKNFSKEPSMTRSQAETSIVTGIEIATESAKKGIDILTTGEMGIGNTTPSSAIFSILGNTPVEYVTGRGTGIDDSTLTKKISIIIKGIDLHKPDPDDPIDILAKVGGFEIGGIAGLILGAAAQKIPVVVDGFISGAGAALALKMSPSAGDYIFPSHRSTEPGHKIFFELLGYPPLFDLNMRLGEGTGALLAVNLIQSAIKIYKEMATFQSAGVSNKQTS